jgi:hypothetical protein
LAPGEPAPRAALGIDGVPGTPGVPVMVRDEQGRAAIRAVRLSAPLRIDGALDEALYTDVPGMTDFVQVEPQIGAPATEKTEVWFAFDNRNVYVSFRCWDSQPRRRVSTEMRRDGGKIFQGDDIAYFFLDTFRDQRNGMTFVINSLGGLNDGQVANDQYQGDWNAVLSIRAGTFEGGWTLEVAIPFRSIRYGAGASQTWGFNALRTVRWRNEFSVLSPVPQWNGLSAARQGRFAATVTGIEVPASGRNVEIKPYAISSLTTDNVSTPRRRNDPDGDVGIDLKYSLTQNVVADFTYNTDFAQVEADEQQLNLTRFNLFFPEKREFFLENQGTFTFGGATSGQGDTPLLFYSRRIGLDSGRPVKIHGGGRVTGRLGAFTIGAIDIVADGSGSVPQSTNFSVARVRRDLFRRSTVGLLYAGRSVGQGGGDGNAVFGVDGIFNFYNFLTINSYWARTRTTRLSGDDASYRGQLSYAGDRWGWQLEHLLVGRHFNPEIGFARRTDIRKSFAQFRFSPRPRSIRTVRKFSYAGAFTYIEDGAGHVQNRQADAEFAIEFQNADRLFAAYADYFELIPRPFQLAPAVTVPVGAYEYDTLFLGYNLGTQRLVAANMLFETGRFYGGRRSALSVTRGRFSIGPQFSVEPTYTVNWIDLPAAAFTSHLAGSRVTYTFTPRMFASALIQFNSLSNTVAANARLRWEYRPGSELFVVYNDERDTRTRSFPGVINHALIVKFNRLLRP